MSSPAGSPHATTCTTSGTTTAHKRTNHSKAAVPFSTTQQHQQQQRRTVLSPNNTDLLDLGFLQQSPQQPPLPPPQPLLSSSPMSRHSSVSSQLSLKPSNPAPLRNPSKAGQLLVGALGIYGAYLYYGHVQEDLFRYRADDDGNAFTYVWFLQVLESALTAGIGYVGRNNRTRRRSRDNDDTSSMMGADDGDDDDLEDESEHHRNKPWPVVSFWKSGASQLAAKALMSLSLAAGLSFPVVVLAKSAKIVPVMIGQLLLGGSNYQPRDYAFAALIVLGTALLSLGTRSSSDSDSGNDDGHNTATGLILILLSLGADGFTGGLQKKLKKETADLNPTAFDFLYFSHCAQFTVALLICLVTGELWRAPAFLQANPLVWWWVAASCVCSAVGQCFIFYVIACFDPLVCTTITTTRKMMSIVFSLTFKGHVLNSQGCVGLALACTALLVEMEGKVHQFRRQHTTSSSSAAVAAAQYQKQVGADKKKEEEENAVTTESYLLEGTTSPRAAAV